MFVPFRQEDPQLNSAIADVYKTLETHKPYDAEYKTAVDQLGKLNDLKNKGIDPNTLVTVAGNLLIAVVVIRFEQTGVITTKLFGFLSKR